MKRDTAVLRELGPIATAAHALEADLARFEIAAETAVRLPLDSQRNLDKATRAINEAAETQQRMGEHIHLLMAALNAARDQNQAAADRLGPRGLEIQAKADEHTSILRQFRELGAVAKEISAAVVVIGKAKGEVRAAATTAEQLGEIEQRMTVVVERAQALMKAAQQAGLGELARDVEALAKQVQSARNKLSLVRGKLAR